ncbi:hypothetical protein ABPG75_008131 [Micractinium tetrahymenae]
MAACSAQNLHALEKGLCRPGSGHLALRSVNHISKVCSSIEASVAFYRDILGFIVIKRPQSFEESFEGCWLWRYGLGLHLIKGQPVPRSSCIDPKSDHLSFQADSLEEVEAQLVRRGIPFVRQAVVEEGIEVQQLFFHDPDNNMIEVCNCDCLPIIPIDLARCATCATEAAAIAGEPLPTLPLSPHVPAPACALQARGHALAVAAQQEVSSEDEVMCESRDSMDSSRSEQYGTTPRWATAAGATAAAALAAAPFAGGDA